MACHISSPLINWQLNVTDQLVSVNSWCNGSSDQSLMVDPLHYFSFQPWHCVSLWPTVSDWQWGIWYTPVVEHWLDDSDNERGKSWVVVAGTYTCTMLQKPHCQSDTVGHKVVTWLSSLIIWVISASAPRLVCSRSLTASLIQLDYSGDTPFLSLSEWPLTTSPTPYNRKEGRKEMFYLTYFIYGYMVLEHMVKEHSDSERGHPLLPHGLLFPINSKGSFICTIPQTG